MVDMQHGITNLGLYNSPFHAYFPKGPNNFYHLKVKLNSYYH